MQEHESVCEHRPVHCSNCGLALMVRKKYRHRTAQPNEAPVLETLGPIVAAPASPVVGSPSRADSQARKVAAAECNIMGNTGSGDQPQHSGAGHKPKPNEDAVPAQRGQPGENDQPQNPSPAVGPAAGGPGDPKMPDLLEDEPDAHGLLKDLISDYERWIQVDATLSRSKESIYALEELVKAEGPETLGPKLLQNWRGLLAAAGEDGLIGLLTTLRCGCLRIMLLILDGKNDIHSKQITKEALRECIVDVLGLGAHSDRLFKHVPRTRKRQAAAVEEGASGKEKENKKKGKVEEGTSGDVERMSKRQRARALRATMLNLLKDLMKEPCADLFCHPIDASEVPGYYERIKSPMCLETIHTKIKQDELHYAAEDLFADMELIRDNAETFNRATNPVIAQQAASLFELFVRDFCAAIDQLKPSND